MAAGLRTIHADHLHLGWDRDLAPVARVEPGESLEFEVVDASGGQLNMDSTAADVASLDVSRANPVTGPIFVEDAEPGDALGVEIEGFRLSGWGWTAIIPEFGLLATDFPDPYLLITRHDNLAVEVTPEIRIPTRPFPGTLGVAPAEAGTHSVIPPRNVGGNMDFRDLTEGARVWLPVEVAGALLSVGDTHAAQGDGEVCGTAVESPMQVTLKFHLRKQVHLPAPQFDLPGAPARHVDGQGYRVTTGVGPDLMEAARDAVRAMIDLLGREYGLDPQLAYCLCSIACDLRITEVVDAPHWMVGCYLPRSIFR